MARSRPTDDSTALRDKALELVMRDVLDGLADWSVGMACRPQPGLRLLDGGREPARTDENRAAARRH